MFDPNARLTKTVKPCADRLICTADYLAPSSCVEIHGVENEIFWHGACVEHHQKHTQVGCLLNHATFEGVLVNRDEAKRFRSVVYQAGVRIGSHSDILWGGGRPSSAVENEQPNLSCERSINQPLGDKFASEDIFSVGSGRGATLPRSAASLATGRLTAHFIRSAPSGRTPLFGLVSTAPSVGTDH